MANSPSRVAKRQGDDRATKRGKRPTGSKRGRAFRIIRGLVIAFLVLLVAGIGLFAWYAKDAPTITEAKLNAGGSTTLYAANGDYLTSLGTANRTYVAAKDIPQPLKDAVVSIEDRRFYKETLGVDPIRIGGAVLANLKAKITRDASGLEGGSTLTQQLVKLSVFSTKASDQTLKRKAQEAWLAMQVERNYSKEQILEFYINKVYMNHGQYGMATGADYYFDKSLNKLSLAQTAFLAGLAQSPVGYDPYAYPERAKTRRDAVINAMLHEEKITEAQAKAAKATPITDGLVPQKQTTIVSDTDKIVDSYLTSVVAEVKKRMDINPYTTNLKIYTNLDMAAQKRLYNIVNTDDYVEFPNDRLQTAVTITDPNTGAVVAQIGGRKTGDVRLAYNRATRSDRSNGSTMKPLMAYAPAIEYLNYSTYQQVMDAKYTYPGTDIELMNNERNYLGRISIRRALVYSQNIPAIKTLDAVGVSRAVNFLKGLGINLPKDQQVISSGIGATVTTEQEAAAYGAFANGGTYYSPNYVTKVVAADGTTTRFTADSAQGMKDSTAYMITDMLKGVISSGTGMGAQIDGLYQAGKSGTTNYSDEELAANPALAGMAKDSLFTGYTRQRVVAVWLGYDKANKDGLSEDTRTITQAIYRNIMSYMARDLPNKNWEKPGSVLVKHIVPGSNPGTAVDGDTRNTTRELYVKGHGPTSVTTVEEPVESSVTTSSETSSSSSSEPEVESSTSSSSMPESTSSATSSSGGTSSSTSSSTAPPNPGGGGGQQPGGGNP